ncbi:MAG: hypothetical protein D6739_05150 [Nitrospirae bacterium]|nr:MAG: hypothetical protein D6739_05150 [Nitrospirota bacterium]
MREPRGPRGRVPGQLRGGGPPAQRRLRAARDPAAFGGVARRPRGARYDPRPWRGARAATRR